MRKWAAILVTAIATTMTASGLTAQAEPLGQPAAPAPGDRALHWELSSGGARAEGEIYFGSGYSAYIYGSITASDSVRKICYHGSAGELGAGGDCTTVRPGRTERFAYRFFVRTEGGVHRVDATLFAEGAEDPVAMMYCTREGCEPIA